MSTEEPKDKRTSVRSVRLSVAQIEKIIVALRALPPEPRSTEWHTDCPEELAEMFQDTIDDPDEKCEHGFLL